MPLSNPKGPNSNEDVARIDQMTSSAEELFNQPLHVTLNAGPNSLGMALKQRALLLEELSNRVDKPILRGLTTDILNVLSSWFQDPEVVCCIIQAIIDMYYAEKYKYEPIPTQTFTFADSNFVKFLDGLIKFIDLILVLLKEDIPGFIFQVPDFMKEIMSAVLGCIILVLSETLYVLRDSVIQNILQWIDELGDQNNPWLDCLPIKRLFDVVKTYIHDYGFLANLFEKIKGFISEKESVFGFMTKGAGLPYQIDNLEFLKWFRDLLIKMKHATISFDMCIQFDYIQDKTRTNDIVEVKKSGFTGSRIPIEENIDEEDKRPAPDKVNVVQHDDGTISINNRPNANDGQTGDQGKGYWRARASSGTIRKLGSMYGFPADIMDQAYNSYTEGDIGTVLDSDGNSAKNNVCPGLPGGEELLKYLRRRYNKNPYRKS